jgi:hypothetical protein
MNYPNQTQKLEYILMVTLTQMLPLAQFGHANLANLPKKTVKVSARRFFKLAELDVLPNCSDD